MNNMIKGFKRDYRNSTDNWTNEYNNMVKKWGIARKQYNKDEEQLSQATFDMAPLAASAPVIALAEDNEQNDDLLSQMKPGDFYVIPNAMTIPIRNQKFRGTCAAFTGIRAVETLLAQYPEKNQFSLDLSEQHFYWISKPDCMSSPCTVANSSEGSYFDTGFINSNKGGRYGALRLESACQYQPKVKKTNLTYTPLTATCTSPSTGMVNVTSINQYLKFEDIVSEIHKNRPVAAGFTLTNSYRKTEGVVRSKDILNSTAAKGKHVSGHAMLLIGYIKLPYEMEKDEGRYCAIMANSWGDGYGAGGYACLTEQWMKDNRFKYSANPSRSLMSSIVSVAVQ
jgi:hypothetical protein